MNHTEILQKIYDEALSQENDSIDLSELVKKQIELIAKQSESNKGLLAVFVTLLTHKIFDPQQDIRYHRTTLPNGFSGRSVDTKFITPFLKAVRFPSMAESGWLTRSFEQAHAYTLDYPGQIKPDKVKTAFLEILNSIQESGLSPSVVLNYLFSLLIIQRDKLNIELAKPHGLPISSIIKLLEKHFTYDYKCYGASRLPTLAIYAAYQCMMKQVDRYKNKKLCPLESHNSADRRSGRIGDIDVNNEDGTAFEGVEIKHEIQINNQLISEAYKKFSSYQTDRYYLLTTANMDSADWDSIDDEISRISRVHGCQVIVNGVYSSLKYYLRLLRDPAEFIENYVELLKVDKTLKFIHKDVWNKVVNEGVK